MVELRSGIDLVEIRRIASQRPEIHARFLQRVFTPLELELSGGSTPSLAGRFAAKEAVAKALGCGIGAIGWHAVEIQRGEQGEPVLVLSGKALQIAESLGLTSWSISISHTRTYAVAVAVAMKLP